MDFCKIRILYAEDDEKWGGDTKDFLESEGFCVDLVQTLDSAYLKFVSGRYDILLLDFDMPGISVMKIIDKIRMRNGLVPVIFYSSFFVPEYAPQLEGYKCWEFISKISPQKELVWRIKRVYKEFVSVDASVRLSDGVLFNRIECSLRVAGNFYKDLKCLALLQVLLNFGGFWADWHSISMYVWHCEKCNTDRLRHLVLQLRSMLKDSPVRIESNGKGSYRISAPFIDNAAELSNYSKKCE